jgi:CDGSH-type Zn-finger protein
VVTPYVDGPLIVRGQFVITAMDGQPIPAGRETVALCRCGRSAIKPFCDGSHARTGFRAADRPPAWRSVPDDGAAGRAPERTVPQDRGRGGRTGEPLAGVPDPAAQPAAQGQPAAD